jgi:hypothetical protein
LNSNSTAFQTNSNYSGKDVATKLEHTYCSIVRPDKKRAPLIVDEQARMTTTGENDVGDVNGEKIETPGMLALESGYALPQDLIKVDLQSKDDIDENEEPSYVKM